MTNLLNTSKSSSSQLLRERSVVTAEPKQPRTIVECLGRHGEVLRSFKLHPLTQRIAIRHEECEP